MSDLAEKFMQLFAGLDRAHGIYILDPKAEPEPGKKIRGKAITYLKPVSVDLWEKHLDGRQGLGIIPIMDDDNVNWAVIDIDRYDLHHEAVSKQLAGGPLIPCLSKSGGFHVFVFMQTPTPAKDVRKKMEELAKALGFGGVEIFPKQTHLNASSNDVGQWLNMPYFDVRKTERCALVDGKRLSAEEFLAKAEASKVTKKQLMAYKIPPISVDTSALPDGPPCLQHLATLGFPKGTRNNGLFNLGVYLRKSVPDSWKDDLDKLNHQFMKPPLKSQEVQTILKSLDRKSYEYKCKDQPVCDHCDKEMCLGRKFGVGNGDEGDMPALAHLTKYHNEDGDGIPTYYLDIEGRRVGPLASEDILNQQSFTVKCFEATGIVCPRVRPERWRALVQKLSDECVLVIVPADSSAKGQLLERLENFVTGHQQTLERDGLLTKRVYYDGEAYYFRMKDFIDFLHRNKFFTLEAHEIAAIMREHGYMPKEFKVKGKFLRVWMVTEITLAKRLKPIDIPEEPY